MIILVDNKNYAIRTCKESMKNHFVETTDGHQFGEMKVLSDIGFRVFVTGPEAEEYLDANNIYYIHVEHKAKENFQNFTKRMEKMIEERVDLINSNDSCEKLIFGITDDGTKATVYNTHNVFTITRDLMDDTLFVRYTIDETLPTYKKVELLKSFEKKAKEKFGFIGYAVEEGDFYEDVNFSTGKTIKEVLAKFHMFIAVMEASMNY